MDIELTLDDILAIEADTKPEPKSRQFGKQPINLRKFVPDNKYVTLDEFDRYACMVCGIKTRFRAEGMPYCSSHLSLYLIHIINRLELQLRDR